MKAWSAFYPDVLPELPGAPDIVVDHWLRNAAIEFCERSRILIEDLDPESAVVGQGEYDLVPDVGRDIVEVIDVSYNGVALRPRSVDYLENTYGGDWGARLGVPDCYTQLTADKLLLVPAPSAALTDAIKIKVALKPSATATGIDDWLFIKYRFGIAAGAKAKLMSMAGNVPWKSPDHVPWYQAQFDAAIADAIDRAKKGLVRAMPRFSGGFV